MKKLKPESSQMNLLGNFSKRIFKVMAMSACNMQQPLSEWVRAVSFSPGMSKGFRHKAGLKILSLFLSCSSFFQPLCAADLEGETPKVDEVGTEDYESLAQRVNKRTYFPNGRLQLLETLTQNEKGQYVEHGMRIEFYPSGKLKSRGSIFQSERNGTWILVDEAGHMTQGHYQDGKRSGNWKIWDANKQLLVNEFYKDDELHGPRQTYHPNGKGANKSFYVSGKKQGVETFWYDNGQTASQVVWVDGERHGKFQSYGKDGQALVDGKFFMGFPDEDWTWWDLDGSVLKQSKFVEGTGVLYEYAIAKDALDESPKVLLQRESSYKDGLLHGTEVFYLPNGSLRSEYRYVDGKKHGKFREWYTNGFLQVEGSYDQDRPIGEVKEYFPPDTKEKNPKSALSKVTIYNEDFIHAEVMEYSPKGDLLSKMKTREGLPDGDFESYYPDGKIMRKGTFSSGLKDGEWFEYYSNGDLRTVQGYLLDKENGRFEAWYERESVAEGEEEKKPVQRAKGSFVNAQRDGLWETWHANASIESRVLFRYGVEDGDYSEWWPQNFETQEEPQLRTEGKYVLGKKQGEWKIWFPNSLLKSKGGFVNGVQEGEALELYDYLIDDEPVVKLRGEFKNGKQHGLWEAFFADGQKELSQSYSEGELEGEVQQFYATGVLKSSAIFKGGRSNGEASTYHPNGNLAVKEVYKDGRKNGSILFYHENGKMRTSGTYQMDIPVGLWKWFDENGRTVLASSNFLDGKGTMYDFYPTSQKRSEIEYLNGVEHGKQLQWYPQGKLKSEAQFHQGVLHGSYKEYHEEGNLMNESSWIYGRRNGSFLAWYGNEQQQLNLFFVDDVPQGESTEWYENGNLKSTGSWVNGKRHGTWSWYDRYGEEILKQVYDAGILVSTTSKESKAKK